MAHGFPSKWRASFRVAKMSYDDSQAQALAPQFAARLTFSRVQARGLVPCTCSRCPRIQARTRSPSSSSQACAESPSIVRLSLVDSASPMCCCVALWQLFHKGKGARPETRRAVQWSTRRGTRRNAHSRTQARGACPALAQFRETCVRLIRVASCI